MATVKAYAFYDKKLGAFMLPFWQPNEAVAKRAAKYSLNNKESNLYPVREDIELWEIGQFEDTVGAISATEMRCIAGMGVLLDDK